MQRELYGASERLLLYVEGRPGAQRSGVVDHLALTGSRSAAERLVYRAVADGLIEAAPTPAGVRLSITYLGLQHLHGGLPDPDDDPDDEETMDTDELYQPPSRDDAVARVRARLPGARVAPAFDGTPVENFSAHLNARMRALGLDQAAIQEMAGITPQTAARAINGTGVGLELAGQLAGFVGLALAVMIGPYTCGTCNGEPPAGFACLECGTEGARQ
jgi:hypothetical protein